VDACRTMAIVLHEDAGQTRERRIMPIVLHAVRPASSLCAHEHGAHTHLVRTGGGTLVSDTCQTSLKRFARGDSQSENAQEAEKGEESEEEELTQEDKTESEASFLHIQHLVSDRPLCDFCLSLLTALIAPTCPCLCLCLCMCKRSHKSKTKSEKTMQSRLCLIALLLMPWGRIRGSTLFLSSSPAQPHRYMQVKKDVGE
jgi:hypothetical protein